MGQSAVFAREALAAALGLLPWKDHEGWGLVSLFNGQLPRREQLS